jgi:glycosyltransferase involved in cell wall biosynthesis
MMPRLRLLVVSPYFAPHVGGLENFVAELDEALLAQGLAEQVTVFTPRLPPGGRPREAPAQAHRIVRYPAFEAIPNFPVPALWRRSLWRAVRDARPGGHDVLVSHTRFFLPSLLALLWARILRRPLVHVEHGSDFVQLQSRFASRVARAYDAGPGRLLLRRADAVVCVSRAAAGFVRELAGREASVVYRGVPDARLRDAQPDAAVLARAAGAPVVAFAGRLIDGKGVHDLLDAFAPCEGALLCIVGDGPRRGDLEAQARRLGIEGRVWFIGAVPEAAALAVLAAADVVVNPSYTEGLPTSVLEAALLGRAVLATDVGGTAEIVTDEHSALLVAPRDVDGLRRSLQRLLGDRELRERLGAAARAGAAERFSWPASARAFAALCEQVRRAPR